MIIVRPFLAIKSMATEMIVVTVGEEGWASFGINTLTWPCQGIVLERHAHAYLLLKIEQLLF